jgi:pimeloyl-ACP methyl ester carboxylesterase
MAESGQFESIRERGDARKALVFVHGFGGSTEGTFGSFPDVLVDNTALAEWDIFLLGYPSSLRLDLVGLWSADPPITSIAGNVADQIELRPLTNYRQLAWVAHSMGGLVVQRALVDRPEFVERTSHVALFGTPSGGLQKALWLRLLKRQIRDMAKGSDFIKHVRAGWAGKFGDEPPFRFVTVAGLEDEFVPESSSLEPFAPSFRRRVPGNHLHIVKPARRNDQSAQWVEKTLLDKRGGTGSDVKLQAALGAGDYDSVAAVLGARAQRFAEHGRALPKAQAVTYAIALDKLGQRDEAIKVIADHPAEDTDLMGTLAGRYKRQWLTEGTASAGMRARQLYARAYREAVKAGDHAQAAYNGINLAFMERAYRNNIEASHKVAREVIEHANQTRPSHWRSATLGEAYLLLGDSANGVAHYRHAVAAGPLPWQVDSMRWQAGLIAAMNDDEQTGRELARVFEEAA